MTWFIIWKVEKANFQTCRAGKNQIVKNFFSYTKSVKTHRKLKLQFDSPDKKPPIRNTAPMNVQWREKNRKKYVRRELIQII